MSAAAGALLAAVADKLADALVTITDLTRDMRADLDPDDAPDYAPPVMVQDWAYALSVLAAIEAMVGEAGATADAAAQAMGELPTSSGWGAAPACREHLCAVRTDVRQPEVRNA